MNVRKYHSIWYAPPKLHFSPKIHYLQSTVYVPNWFWIVCMFKTVKNVDYEWEVKVAIFFLKYTISEWNL